MNSAGVNIERTCLAAKVHECHMCENAVNMDSQGEGKYIRGSMGARLTFRGGG